MAGRAASYNEDERELFMGETAFQSSSSPAHHAGKAEPNDSRERCERLSSDGFMTIGAHTVTHPVLSKLGTAACLREIAREQSCVRGYNRGAR